MEKSSAVTPFAFFCLRDGDDEFVARAAFRIGEVETLLGQLRGEVVRVERRVFADARHAFAAEQARVDVRAQQHACVAGERGQATDRSAGDPSCAPSRNRLADRRASSIIGIGR